MKNLTSRTLSILLAIALFPNLLQAGELEDAQEFYNRKEYSKAIEIIKPAVDRKEPKALNTMADFYEYGRGVPIDLQTALNLYKKAAELGDSNAQFNMGRMYHHGIHVKPNVMTAISWYKKSSENGNEYASYNLGFIYLEGKQIKENIPLGIKYYEDAFKKGNESAAYNLGVIYSEGRHNIKTNKKMASFFYTIAAAKNHSLAMHNLAVMYRNGEGVLQNYEESVRLHVQAIKQKLAPSMSALSGKYVLGEEGISRNMKLGHMWALLAIYNGDANAKILKDVTFDRLSQQDLLDAQKLAAICRDSDYQNCQYPEFLTKAQ